MKNNSPINIFLFSISAGAAILALVLICFGMYTYGFVEPYLTLTGMVGLGVILLVYSIFYER